MAGIQSWVRCGPGCLCYVFDYSVAMANRKFKVSATCKSNVTTAGENPYTGEHARRWTRKELWVSPVCTWRMESEDDQARFAVSSSPSISRAHLLGAQISSHIF